MGDRLLLLDNPVQHYAWGSREAIPRLLGRDNESGEPWAEVWMGAHPSAPSRVADQGGERLDRLVAERPEALLGARVARTFGRLPFLFKILAAARPLSIQCHPDAESARRGFERENLRGLAPDDRSRNYRDTSHKPELLCALERFEVLAGFRPPEEVRRRFDAAGVRSLTAELALLDGRGGLERFVPVLLRLPEARRALAVAEAAAGLIGDDSPEARWVRRLAVEFPADTGALAPLYLNYLELAPGEAIYLGAGVLHSYLEGTGLELMASSDNVLRGGLTEKHIDVDELCAVAHFEAGAPDRRKAEGAGDRLSAYDTAAREFRLGVIDLSGGPCRRERGADAGPEILLLLGGGCTVTDVDGGGAVDLRGGQALLVAGPVGDLELAGEGTVYTASVPE